MIKAFTCAALAIALATGGAFAQTTPPKAPAVDAAVDVKFKAADKNSNGTLDGGELDAYKATLTSIDTDKDGKVSKTEFSAGMTAGHIK